MDNLKTTRGPHGIRKQPMQTHDEQLAALFNSSDIEQIQQGLLLLESLNSPELEDTLLADSWLMDVPTVEWVWSGSDGAQCFRCFTLNGVLEQTAFYSHIVALILLTRQILRDPERLAQHGGFQRILMQAVGTAGFQAVRELELPSGALIEIESGPMFSSPEALLDWVVRSELWRPREVPRLADIVITFVRGVLRDLPSFYPHVPVAFREVLFGSMLRVAAPVELSFYGVALKALPDWVDLASLKMLNIASTGLLSPLPAQDSLGLSLCIDHDQWTAWGGRLPRAEGVSLEGLREGAELSQISQMQELRTLSLMWDDTVPDLGECLSGTSGLEELELISSCGGPVPVSVWQVPSLRILRLTGFESIALTGTPPAHLTALFIHEDGIASMTPAWRSVVRSPRHRAVWLMGTSRKISTIKEVRRLLSIGLKEAKDLVESAPQLLKKGTTQREADRIRQVMVAAGARVSLR